MTNSRIVALIFLGGVFIMEGFDIAAMGIAVPRLEEALGIAPASFGWVLTGILVGLGVGGATLAPLGDRFGRRALIVAGCLATGLFTIATATADDTTMFLVWRFLTGFALGACLPNVSALSSELAPERLRATVMAVVSAGIPLGLSIAGVLAPEVIAAWGWQGLFYVPGGFAVLLAGVLWLVLEGGAPASAASKEDAAPAAKLPQLVLFARPWAFPFAVFATMLGLNALNLYLLNSWLPTVLPQAGLSLDDAARVAGVANLAGLGIGIGFSLLLDNWKKGPALMLMFGAMAASFTAIALTAPDQTRWTLLLMVGVGGANAGGMVLPGLAAHLFPARLLSSAVGMGVLVARLGAFAGPPLGAAMLAAEVPARVFLGVAAIPAFACVVVALLVARALLVKERVAADEA
ncbi:MFS transporter [Alteraurantiacibacter aestuarii]|uniref:MFS transporter n=1 Tax=Alteraurantiacibacter aestuarii TaxID=650004 RepID=A0A844ZJQ7_9SPHN|nr:MFS transporter [Alteraurantiacibacter aestuarii]MXO87376.1 MFS transporter [Alteraurantiacibacter aestuarii]